MRFVRIDKRDMSNGMGLRVVLWVIGCEHHCDECHNMQTWDFSGGKEFTIKDEKYILRLLNEDTCRGITISGGDPLALRNRKEVLSLCERIKEHCGKSIWVYTGYKFEDLDIDFTNIDVLVDGRFEKDKRVYNEFRGSSNQRIIDINKTKKEGKVVLWNGGLLDKYEM